MNNKQKRSSQSRVLVRILRKLPLKQIFIYFPTKISEFFPRKSRKAEMKFSCKYHRTTSCPFYQVNYSLNKK